MNTISVIITTRTKNTTSPDALEEGEDGIKIAI